MSSRSGERSPASTGLGPAGEPRRVAVRADVRVAAQDILGNRRVVRRTVRLRG